MDNVTPLPDPAAALAELRARFPHVVIWHGDRLWFAHTRLGPMAATSAAELAWGLEELRSGSRRHEVTRRGCASGGY